MVLSYLPGEKYEGKVTFIYPYLQPKTRDIIIRLEFENPDLKLKPEMYGDVMIHTKDRGEGLVVPAESIIPVRGAQPGVLSPGKQENLRPGS